jgi:HEPN domain-containing protein
MTSDRIARDYLQQARTRRMALNTFVQAGAHAVTVRESQDIVELIFKGALRFVGVEPPKRHDAHRVVERFIERFPADWRAALTDLRAPLDRLAEDRGPSFYGDEAEDIPAADLFEEADARDAIAVVDRLPHLYVRLLGEAERG